MPGAEEGVAATKPGFCPSPICRGQVQPAGQDLSATTRPPRSPGRDMLLFLILFFYKKEPVSIHRPSEEPGRPGAASSPSGSEARGEGPPHQGFASHLNVRPPSCLQASVLGPPLAAVPSLRPCSPLPSAES